MNRRLMAIVVACALCSMTHGAGLSQLFTKLHAYVPPVCKKWCADDYDAKCPPSVCEPGGKCPDDYCAKAAPSVCVDCGVCPEDYQEKCAPNVRVVDTDDSRCVASFRVAFDRMKKWTILK